MRRETSRVSFLMCPFCVRVSVPRTTTISRLIPVACCLFSKHTSEADTVRGGERSSGLRIVYFLRAKLATLQFAAALSRAGHKSRGTVI